MTARRMAAFAGATVLIGALALLAAGSASAATGTYLRLAHLSPDTPAVDVLVTSFSGETVRLDGVTYGDVSTYTRIDPGRYTLQMLPAGAADGTAPVVTGTLDAVDGAAYTAAGLGPRAELAIRVLQDDLTPPGPDQARIRVVQGAEQAGPLDLRWSAAPAFDDVAFGIATDYVTVPAGSGELEIVPASGPAARVPVLLSAGSVYSVVVVQRDGQLTAQVATDATGSGEVPVGGIDTGLGGTAGPSALVPAGVAMLAVLAGAGALVGLRAARRTR